MDEGEAIEDEEGGEDELLGRGAPFPFSLADLVDAQALAHRAEAEVVEARLRHGQDDAGRDIGGQDDDAVEVEELGHPLREDEEEYRAHGEAQDVHGQHDPREAEDAPPGLLEKPGRERFAGLQLQGDALDGHGQGVENNGEDDGRRKDAAPYEAEYRRGEGREVGDAEDDVVLEVA